jgi:hypothetical protein
VAGGLLHLPAAYTVWARASLRIYQALTYSRGHLGRTIDGIERRLSTLKRRLP